MQLQQLYGVYCKAKVLTCNCQQTHHRMSML